jgi:hypothetical protein
MAEGHKGAARVVRYLIRSRSAESESLWLCIQFQA